MIYVEIWGVDNDCNPVLKGTIGWDGARYVLNPPDSALLHHILNYPCFPPRADKGITSATPEQFLYALKLQYHGSRVWAEGVKNTNSPASSPGAGIT